MRSFRPWIIGYVLILSLTLLTAHWGSQAVTVLAETSPPKRHRTIIIDAGHGGVDGGATSCTGVPESRFNLEISLRLNDFLHFHSISVPYMSCPIELYARNYAIMLDELKEFRHLHAEKAHT